MYRSALNPKEIETPIFESFEHLAVSLTMDSKQIIFVVIYRPPGLSMALFLKQFADLLGILVLDGRELLISGDFNLHVNNASDVYAQKFNELLNIFSLSQHVKTGTHLSGNILDLVITRNGATEPISSLSCDMLISDHYSLVCTLPFAKQSLDKKVITYRKIRSIDMLKFKEDIGKLEVVTNPPENLDHLVNEFNSQLRALLDIHAPEITKTITVRTFNDF